MRIPVRPHNTLRPWPQLPQQLLLVHKIDVHLAVAESLLAVVFVLVLSYECDGLFLRAELDVAVHGFGGGPLHDDVDAAFRRALEDAGGAAHVVDDFVFGDGVGNLNGGE